MNIHAKLERNLQLNICTGIEKNLSKCFEILCPHEWDGQTDVYIHGICICTENPKHNAS